MEPSPWQSSKFDSEVRRTFDWVAGGCDREKFPSIAWILDHGLVNRVYQSLSGLAPLLPTYGWEGKILLWSSPALSGSDNIVAIVCGKDQNDTIRIAGTNFAAPPCRPDGRQIDSAQFFRKLDSFGRSETLARGRLFGRLMESNLSSGDIRIFNQMNMNCGSFRTMPICLIVLDSDCTHFTCFKAIVDGKNQAACNLEYVGEF